MGLKSLRFWCYLFVMMCSIATRSHSQEYYDPVTRRYVQKFPDNVQSQDRRPIVKRGYIPTEEEIMRTRLEAERQRRAEEERLRQARNSSAIEARRRYDPNRYHSTEEVDIMTQ